MVEGIGLENRHTAKYRGFESSLIREGYLAQLEEQFAYNEKVSGSSPLIPTAGVVELADTPDLGSGDSTSCGFKSCHPYGEEWLSGSRHWFAKSAYTVCVPWVQIPFLPNWERSSDGRTHVLHA